MELVYLGSKNLIKKYSENQRMSCQVCHAMVFLQEYKVRDAK